VQLGAQKLIFLILFFVAGLFLLITLHLVHWLIIRYEFIEFLWLHNLVEINYVLIFYYKSDRAVLVRVCFLFMQHFLKIFAMFMFIGR